MQINNKQNKKLVFLNEVVFQILSADLFVLTRKTLTIFKLQSNGKIRRKKKR